MRIAFLTTQWPGIRLGGIGAYTLRCAEALAAAGHEAHVFTLALPEDVRRAVPAGVILHEVEDMAGRVGAGSLPGALAAVLQSGGEGMYRLGLGALLCAAVRRVHGVTPLDLVEGPEYEALGLPLLLDPIPGLPVVTHLHSGSAIRRLGNEDPETVEQSLLESLECATILAADSLCAPSKSVVENTRNYLPLEREVGVIGLPFQYDPAARFTPPPVDGPILYVGRLERLKGMVVLAEALRLFLPRFPKARVRLVGPDTATAPGGGSMAAWLRGRIASPQLEIVGERTGRELAEEYQKAAFCVIPSLYESYSYVACEALAAGRAVVVSAGIGAAEVMGEAGVPFTRGNADSLAAVLAECVLHPESMRAAAGVAFGRAGELHAAAMAGRMEFYRAVVAAARARGGAGVAAAVERLAGIPLGRMPAMMQTIVRVAGALAGVADPASRSPGARLLAIMNRHAAECGAARATVLLYGAGRHTARLLAEKHLWEQAGHRVIGLVDDHPRFGAEPVAWGLPVESVAQLGARLPLAEGNVAVVLSTDTFEEQFWRQTQGLRDAGMRVFRLYA